MLCRAAIAPESRVALAAAACCASAVPAATASATAIAVFVKRSRLVGFIATSFLLFTTVSYLSSSSQARSPPARRREAGESSAGRPPRPRPSPGSPSAGTTARAARAPRAGRQSRPSGGGLEGGVAVPLRDEPEHGLGLDVLVGVRGPDAGLAAGGRSPVDERVEQLPPCRACAPPPAPRARPRSRRTFELRGAPNRSPRRSAPARRSSGSRAPAWRRTCDTPPCAA